MINIKRSITSIYTYAGLPFLLGILLTAGCYRHAVNPFLEGIRLEGFEQAGALKVYNAHNIFDYLNGEAEVYLPLGFKQLYMQTYETEETGARMIMEAYDMTSPAGAHDIFERYSKKRGRKIDGIGESAWTDNYIVLFRHERLFLRIWADPDPEVETKPTIRDLIELSKNIDGVLKTY
jgi:hypothetical protein